jgi:hypothetical protein
MGGGEAEGVVCGAGGASFLALGDAIHGCHECLPSRGLGSVEGKRGRQFGPMTSPALHPGAARELLDGVLAAWAAAEVLLG